MLKVTRCEFVHNLPCEQVSGRLTELEAENAKLRELLADTLMQPRDYCQKYGIEYDSWDSVNEHLDARMRELGVDDG